jgi:N-acetylmuramoyl-L-alanine amidase
MVQCVTSRGRTRAVSLAALLALAPLAAAQTQRAPQRFVTAVRHWVLADTTRIAVEVSGEFSFRTDTLHNPERVYFDIPNARPNFDSHRVHSETLPGPLAQRIRVAETTPGVTRVVIDLVEGVEVASSTLSNPHRLMVELKRATGAARSKVPETDVPAQPPVAAQPRATASGPDAARPAAPAVGAPPRSEKGTPPAAAASVNPPKTVEPETPQLTASGSQTPASLPDTPRKSAAPPKPAPASPNGGETAAEVVVVGPRAPTSGSPGFVGPRLPARAAQKPVEPAPATRTSAGESSLVRALGLKISRVVIDAGHGGHDQGAEGVHGLLEKDLVLDIALRLGSLVETRIGAEVVYTRSDDTYIALRDRTALANERKADLFLSIHANSTPSATKAAGIETYYLNITGSKEGMDVAARENATSDQSVFELASLIQKIAKQEKAEESREFANRVQSALFSLEAKNVPGAKNRGVKSAPLVVLIGAHMPSVLVEIGFLSNSREESLLKKPDYRQKLAEALFKGVTRYTDSLSHFETAAAGDPK